MELELLVRSAVMMQMTGMANTPTFDKLSVPMARFLMDPANHAKYLKIQKEVESEYRQVMGTAGTSPVLAISNG